MKTMVVDNNLENIQIYDKSGIDRIFIDLETLGKVDRQGHLDTVISDHTLDDIKDIKPILKSAKILVRVNPINSGSKIEIPAAIKNGADIVMLPMFKTAEEVEAFIKIVDQKATVCLLLETSEALCRIDEILSVVGIDEIHIGLNDLHLSLGLNFMFELMGGDLIAFLAGKIKSKNIPFGVGGVAKMDEGVLNGKIIIREHVRLGSTMVILSRSFKGSSAIELRTLAHDISQLHQAVSEAKNLDEIELFENKLILREIANEIAFRKRQKYPRNDLSFEFSHI